MKKNITTNALKWLHLHYTFIQKKSLSNFIKIKLEGLLLIQSITDLYLPTKLIKL